MLLGKGEREEELHDGLRGGLEPSLGHLDFLHDPGLVELFMLARGKQVEIEDYTEIIRDFEDLEVLKNDSLTS